MLCVICFVIGMRYLSGKERLALTGILWSTVLAGFVLGAIFPLYLRLQNFPALYQESQNRLQEIEANIAGFNSVRSEFEDIMTQVPRLRALYLNPKDAVGYIEALENLTKEFELYKEIRLVSEPASAGGLSTQPSFVFQVTLVGSFEHLMQFFARLESFPYLVDVEKMTFAPAKESQTYGAQFSGETRIFKPQAGDITAGISIRVHATP